MGHPAVFPTGLPEFFIKLFSKEGDTVLDPFGGSGSTAIACIQLSRNCVLIDNKPDYISVIKNRLKDFDSLFTDIRFFEKEINITETKS